MPLYYILVAQVPNRTCWNIAACSQLVRDIQNCDKSGDVPFNFLVGSDGNTYEGQGWGHQSLLNISFPEPVDSKPYLVIAFMGKLKSEFLWVSSYETCLLLGNFTSSAPHSDQLGEAKSFISESILRNRLQEQYILVGLRNLTRSNNDGDRLFKELGSWQNYYSTIGVHL